MIKSKLGEIDWVNKISTILFNSILFLLFLLTPLINNESFVQPTIVSKTFFFNYGLMLAIIFWILERIVSKKDVSHFKATRTDLFLTLYVIYILVNRFFIQDYHGLSIRFLDLLGLITLYILLRSLPITSYYWLFTAIVLAGIFQAVYGNLQILGYYPSLNSRFSISGSFFNPGPYAGYLASVFPIAFGMYFYNKGILDFLKLVDRKKGILNDFKRYFLIYVPQIGMTTILIVLPATRSRASWIAVLVSFFFLLLHKPSYLRNKLDHILPSAKKIFVVILISISLVMCLLAAYFLKKDSADGRLLIWRIGIDMIKQNPLYGVGYNRFETHFMDFQAEYFEKRQGSNYGLLADNTGYAFNEPLQFLIENGIIGILMAGFIVVFLLVKVPTENQIPWKLSIATLLSIGFFGMFSYPSEILPIKMIGVLALSCISLSNSQNSQWIRNLKWNRRGQIIRTGIIGTIILSLFIAYKEFHGLGKNIKKWKNAQDLYYNGLYEESLKIFDSLYPSHLNTNGEFLMNYGKALSIFEEHKKAINILERSKRYLNNVIIETTLGDSYKAIGKYSQAEAAYEQAANMIPHRFYPQYLLTKLYFESGQYAKANQTAKIVLAKPVKVSSRAISEMKIEIEKLIKIHEKESTGTIIIKKNSLQLNNKLPPE